MTTRILSLLAVLSLSLIVAHAAEPVLEVGSARFAIPSSWVPVTPDMPSPARIAQWDVSQGGRAVAFYFGAGKGGDSQANLAALSRRMTTLTGAPSPLAEEGTLKNTAGTLSLSWFVSYGIYSGDPLRSGIPALPKPDWGLIGIAVEFPDGPAYFRLTGPAATIRALVPRLKKPDLLYPSFAAPVVEAAAPKKAAAAAAGVGSKAKK